MNPQQEQLQKLQEDLDNLDIPSAPNLALDSLLSIDPEITKIKEQVRQMIGSDLPVHITGETGTGKELIAKALHGDKPEAKFVPVNCGGIPSELLEAEFFGALAGSYTGCSKNREGYVSQASSTMLKKSSTGELKAYGVQKAGTLFLDEIGDMPSLLQCKLLRFLQDKKYRPIGSQTMREADCRIVSATNKDLLGGKDNFRTDLYYRLAVFTIELPPFRSRPAEDIMLLIKKFSKRKVEKHNELFNLIQLKRKQLMFDKGNVRAILNYIEVDNFLLTI